MDELIPNNIEAKRSARPNNIDIMPYQAAMNQWLVKA